MGLLCLYANVSYLLLTILFTLQKPTDGVNMLRLSCLAKCASIINMCLAKILFSAIKIQGKNPIAFCRVVTSAFTYKYTVRHHCTPLLEVKYVFC